MLKQVGGAPLQGDPNQPSDFLPGIVSNLEPGMKTESESREVATPEYERACYPLTADDLQAWTFTSDDPGQNAP